MVSNSLDRLPLPKEPPDVFKCLPEYFLEDVVGTFKFIFRYVRIPPRQSRRSPAWELIEIQTSAARHHRDPKRGASYAVHRLSPKLGIHQEPLS